MQIVTTSGKTFEAAWTLLTQTRQGAKQLVIQLPGTLTPEEVVSGLVGAQTIKEYKGEDACTTYEGYVLMSSLIYTPDRSALRLTLEKDDAA